MTPAYAYKGINQSVGREGRYPSQCFENQQSATEVVAVDLAENGKWGSYGIQIDNDGDGQGDTETTTISNPVMVSGRKAIVIDSAPVAQDHASLNPSDPNPFAGGLSVVLSNDGRYQKATHLEIWVRPQTAATLIVELYDQDGATPTNQCSKWDTTPPGPEGCLVGGLGKDPGNYWLPITGDQFVAKLHLTSNGDWQRLLIPLDRFVDWNRARDGKLVPGITENIGDGKLNPQSGEEFALHFTLVGANWGSPIKLAVGQQVRFVTIESK